MIGRTRGRGSRRRSDVQSRTLTSISVEQARRNSTVVAAVSIISRGVGQLTFKAPDSRDVEKLFRKPNNVQSSYEFFHGSTWDLLFYGNAFLRVFRGSASGRVQFIAPMDPEKVRPYLASTGFPRYRITDEGLDLSHRDVVHIRDGGGHELWAQSRLEGAGRRVMSLVYADNLIQDTFEHGISAQYAMTSTDKIDPEKIREWGLALEESFGSSGNRRGGVMVLGSTNNLVKLPGMTPADADLRALRESLIREIAGVYQIPPFLVGGASDTKYSNVTARMTSLQRETFAPITTAICQKLEMALDTKVECDLTELLKGDLATQARLATQLSGGPVLSPNEARTYILDLDQSDQDGMDTVKLATMSTDLPAEPGEREGEFPTDDGTTDPEVEVEESRTSSAPHLRVIKNLSPNEDTHPPPGYW